MRYHDARYRERILIALSPMIWVLAVVLYVQVNYVEPLPMLDTPLMYIDGGTENHDDKGQRGSLAWSLDVMPEGSIIYLIPGNYSIRQTINIDKRDMSVIGMNRGGSRAIFDMTAFKN